MATLLERDHTSGLGIFDPDLYVRGDAWQAGLPFDRFQTLRDEHPLYWQPLDDEPLFVEGTWVISRHADIVAMLSDTARFTTAGGTSVRQFDPTILSRGGRPTMMTMDGSDHHRNRTVVSRLFSPAAIRGYEASFREIAAGILDRALAKKDVDFVTDIATYMPLDAISEILGVPPEDREQVLAWTNMIGVPIDPHYTPTRDDFTDALNGIWDYGLKITEKRRIDPDPHVMTAVAQAVEAGIASLDEVQGYMLQLAVAGNETTRNAIAFGLHALLLRPDQMAILRGMSEVPSSAVEEILRWASPTIHTVRVALQDVELYRQTIREGQRCASLLPSANMAPGVFDEPERFDVLRKPNKHVALGIANHICLGIHLARLEIKVLLEELLKRTSHIELTGEVEFVRDNLIHGVKRMPVTLTAA